MVESIISSGIALSSCGSKLSLDGNEDTTTHINDSRIYMICPKSIKRALQDDKYKFDPALSDSTEETVFKVCQELVRTNDIESIKWETNQILQGELLDFGIVVLPPKALYTQPPEALLQWTQKFLKSNIRVDIITPHSGTISTNQSADLILPQPQSQSQESMAKQSDSDMPPFSVQDIQGISALSCQFWEAQAFPIDAQETVTAECMYFTYESSLPDSDNSTKPAILCHARIPMTVSPQCLKRPLILTCVVKVPKEAPKDVSMIKQIRSNIFVPFNACSAVHGICAAETQTLYDTLSAPTLALNNVPFSSAVAASIGTIIHNPKAEKSADAENPVSDDQETEEPIENTPSSLANADDTAIELLVQAIGSSSLNESVSENQNESFFLEISSCCYVNVQRPLQVTTALVDSFMYVQIENCTDDIPLLIENVILRSVNSHAQGVLPVVLQASEQYSVLLRLDESFFSTVAPRWNSYPSNRNDQVPTKAVLPLCLKWRVCDSSGPAVWSQFGAECQLPQRQPIQVSITFLGDAREGAVFSIVVTITNNENQELDILAVLPKDIYSQARESSKSSKAHKHVHEVPPLIPLSSKKDMGTIYPGSSQSVDLQFLATRCGLHILPPIMLIDRNTNRKLLAKGCNVVVTQ